MDSLFEEYTSGGQLIAHTHTHSHVQAIASSQLTFPMEKTTDAFVFFLSLRGEEDRKSNNLRQLWHLVAEAGATLRRCSGAAPFVPLNYSIVPPEWLICSWNHHLEHNDDIAHFGCVCVCVCMDDYWHYQQRKANATRRMSQSSRSTGLHYILSPPRCERGATSVKYVGGEMYRMYIRGFIVSAGHRDRWTNIVLLGDVGHWSWLTILQCY